MPRDPHRDQPILLGGAALADATGALVLLHGRGGSAQDMLARDLTSPPATVRESFRDPLSATRSGGTTAGQGVRPEGSGGGLAWFVPEAAGRQWYPYSLLEKPERNRSHLSSALALLKRVMEKIAAANLGPERVVLLGFSQGAPTRSRSPARDARCGRGVGPDS